MKNHAENAKSAGIRYASPTANGYADMLNGAAALHGRVVRN
jgi:hypothetical protein